MRSDEVVASALAAETEKRVEIRNAVRPVPQLLIDDGGVLAGIGHALVHCLPEIHPIGEDVDVALGPGPAAAQLVIRIPTLRALARRLSVRAPT